MMAKRKPRPTSDAVEIMHRRFIAGRPEREAGLEAARLSMAIGQEIYDLRTKAGLTQKQLANLVGTSHSVISRLEDADYDGHSLKLLQRICSALHHRLEVRFIPTSTRGRKSA
jgi:DNA-binding XRE family transcriptional regulator